MAAIELPGLTSKTPASLLTQLFGQGGEAAQDGGIPGDFAAMLAASQTAAANPASLLPAMPTAASGKPAGKAGGKSLPDDLPLADTVLPADLPEGESEEPASQPEPTLPTPALPVLAQPPVAIPPQLAPQAIAGEAPPAAEASRGSTPQQAAPVALPQTIAAQVARIVAGQDNTRPAARTQQAGVQVTAVGVAFELPAVLPAQTATQTAAQTAAQTSAQTPAAAAPAQPAMIPAAALLPRGEAQPAAMVETAMAARRAAAASADLPTAAATIEPPAEGMALRTDMAAAPAPALPAAGAPAAPAPAAPHDFATLVDRLIEARDAALASQSPQVVHSTLRHADFGQVSIRFETAADGLSASLSSPDPDFARAVQASAAAGQGSLNAEQQGGQSRQDAAGNSAFAQSQQRSSGNQPQGAESRWRDNSSAGHRGDDSDNTTAPQGRGIYA